MIGPVLRLAAAAAVLTAGAGWPDARAQEPAQPPGAVRGEVRATTGERIPYAIVILTPGARQRFADDSGAFRFEDVPPGPHRLLFRQVGFSPLDTSVTVAPGSALTLTARLARVTVQLSEITISAPAECVRPGPPDSTLHPQLAAVFEQLRENAERYRLLADSYPAELRMARAFGELDTAGTVNIYSSDTTTMRTDARWHYVPGRVIADAGRGSRRLLLPTLPELADSAFQAGHCFYLAGIDTAGGARLVRVDFLPPVRLRSPDVGGSAYLDTATYQIRHVTVRLTNPQRANWRIEELAVDMSFREVVPSIVLVDHIAAVTRLLQEFRHPPGYTEEQRLLAVHFLRPLVPARR
jgi:hypothetical protein